MKLRSGGGPFRVLFLLTTKLPLIKVGVMPYLRFIIAVYLVIFNPLWLLVEFPYGLVVWGVLTLVGFWLLACDVKDRGKRRPKG